MIHYPTPPHRAQAFAGLYWGAYPIAERLCQEIVSLPMGPHLTERQVRHVCAAVTDFRTVVSRAA